MYNNNINGHKNPVSVKGNKFGNATAIKIFALMAIISLQFILFPINASQAGSNSLSFTTAQTPTITISVQNYTDIQGHNDILTATTSYSSDQLSLVIDNHVSKFGIGSLTFNLSVLPIGTYSVGACDKQAEFCSPLKTIIIKGAPAPAAPQQTQPTSSSSTSNKSTSSSPTTSNTETATTPTTVQQQTSSSGTSNNSSYTSAYNSNTATSANTTSKNTTVSTKPVSTYQNNNLTATTGTNNTTSANTITSKTSNSSTPAATQNSTTATGTANASSQSGNTTTTSFSGGISIGTILPVLLGIAIAIALGYTVLNNRKKGVQGAV